MSRSIFKDFARVTKKHPCPVCGKTDWCMVSNDDATRPSRCLCKRIESPRKWGNAGWLHDLRIRFVERGRPRFGFSMPIGVPLSNKFDAIATDALRNADPLAITTLSNKTSLSIQSLLRLRAGWLSQKMINDFGTRSRFGAWLIPMRDHHGRICGIRMRSASGKFALNGSQNGLFIPADLVGPIDRLLLAEGESDTAALLDLGFCAVGIPGAGNADDLVVRFTRNIRPREIVLVSDNDNVGRSRARALGLRLSANHPVVRVIAPPQGIKDARAWKIAGADAAAVEMAISASLPIRMSVVRCARGG